MRLDQLSGNATTVSRRSHDVARLGIGIVLVETPDGTAPFAAIVVDIGTVAGSLEQSPLARASGARPSRHEREL